LIKDTRWLSGSDLAKEADLLLHDAQYTATEYTERIGWGHSSMDDTLEFASLTGAKHLLLTHHDPLRTDDELDEIHHSLKETTSYAFRYEIAVEGQQFQL
jgi:ribonuclease BN (tRNA processing enzyme)